ncbi:hypothetical protein GIB67_040612 [Kingdonia uniflora]|uniref:DUF4283 domain-containing protein n=1 Tax=Kingdonia uniflora TaxID=39325 RepID=A0A7J7M8X8_9MAGN|nr:hypothetical protein GIB67_040612 [Kingdonia uniflora]
MDLWEMEMASKVKALNHGAKKSTFADLLQPKSMDLSLLPIPTMRGDFPSIRIPEAGFLRGMERYKFSLIGRLDLMKVKLAIARTEAMNKWNLTGNCQFAPLGKGYFMILLDNEADKLRIWGGGPWHIKGKLLRVTMWTLDFDINKQKNTHAMVWVKFPGLGIEYWEEDVLMSMARTVGNPAQVDSNTLCRNTGFYASVLVDVDFSKPVPTKIMVEREGFELCQEIQLGRTSKICSHCKVVGHLVSECRNVLKEIEQEKVIQNEADKEPKKKRRNRKKPEKNEQDKSGLEEAADGLKKVDSTTQPIQPHKTFKGVVELWDRTIRNWDGLIHSQEVDFLEKVDKEASMFNKSWADMVKEADSAIQVNTEEVENEESSGSESHGSKFSSNFGNGFSEDVVYQTQEAEEWHNIVVGDFNIVPRAGEKKGGRGLRWRAVEEFQDFVHNSCLLEANSSGSEYTWYNGQMGNNRILCKLDRMLCNQSWSNLFPGWKYKVMARKNSNHSPLFGWNVGITKPANVPFHFCNMWTRHDSLLLVVKENWDQPLVGDPLFKIGSKLRHLKSSSIWAGVRGAIEDVRADSGWVIRDGACINLWRDIWCSQVSLKDWINDDSIPWNDMLAKVSSIIVEGRWVIPPNLQLLFHRLGVDFHTIKINKNKADRRVWKPDLMGKFSVKGAFEAIRNKVYGLGIIANCVCHVYNACQTACSTVLSGELDVRRVCLRPCTSMVEVFLVLMLSFGTAHLSSTKAVSFNNSFECSISLERLRGLSYYLVGLRVSRFSRAGARGAKLWDAICTLVEGDAMDEPKRQQLVLFLMCLAEDQVDVEDRVEDEETGLYKNCPNVDDSLQTILSEGLEIFVVEGICASTTRPDSCNSCHVRSVIVPRAECPVGHHDVPWAKGKGAEVPHRIKLTASGMVPKGSGGVGTTRVFVGNGLTEEGVTHEARASRMRLIDEEDEINEANISGRGQGNESNEVEELEIIIDVSLAVVVPKVGASSRGCRIARVVRESDEEEIEEGKGRGNEGSVDPSGDEREEGDGEQNDNSNSLYNSRRAAGPVSAQDKARLDRFMVKHEFSKGPDSIRDAAVPLKVDEAEPSNRALTNPKRYIDELIDHDEASKSKGRAVAEASTVQQTKTTLRMRSREQVANDVDDANEARRKAELEEQA